MSIPPGHGERVEAAEKPRSRLATETQFFQLAEKIPLVLWIRGGRDGKMQYVSPAYESVWGRPVSELMANPDAFLEVVHPEDLETAKSSLGFQDQPGSAEYRIRLPDKAVRWIRSVQYPVLNQDGSISRVIGISEDITERKSAEERMHLQHSALEASANGIMITDAGGTILWVNQAMASLTGYAAEELKGRNPRIFKGGGQDPATYQQLWAAITAGHAWHGELANKRKDGTVYQEELTVTPCRDQQGKITHFIAIKQDVTERKQLQAQSLRGQRMETIGTLASGIAHDLNNVLAPVLMCATLLREADTAEEREKVLAILEESVRHGSELIKQVLAFARGIANEPMLLQPAHLVKEFKRMVEKVFPRSIEIALEYSPGVHSILADPTQIHQVLMNLCVNGRDAMPNGGKLTISLANVIVDEAYARLVPEGRPGPYVVLAVTDTGVGIAPEIRTKIFEPFFTTKGGGAGSGLGLTTTVAIIKAHHGFLHVYSEPGKGSTFKVHLPALPAAPGNRTQTEAARLPRGHGQCVLVADDEESVRSVCKHVLERFGYRTLTARDGKEALLTYRQHAGQVDLVIMDLMMPVMDGAAAIQALKSEHPHARIIAASGLGPDQALKAQAGHDVFLQKPWTTEALLKAVSFALASSRQPGQAATPF